MRLYGGPAVCAVPSCAPFMSRMSHGSILHFSANSSITASDAIGAWVATGARYAAVLGRFTTTSYASIRIFGMLYGATVHIPPALAGEPGKASASYAIQTCAATILPSLVAPILQRSVPPEVGPLARNTSPRLMTSFTGWPVFFDSNTDSGSR